MYTIYNADHGYVVSRNASIEEAAIALLSDDGYEFEISPDESGVGHRLWISATSRNSASYNGLVESSICSPIDDLEKATEDIYWRVVKSGYWDSPMVMTDAEYDQMVIDSALDEAEPN